MTTILHRHTFEGEDPLWHPSTWRIIVLETGQSAKAGVMGGTKERREAWLDEWEGRVLASAETEEANG